MMIGQKMLVPLSFFVVAFLVGLTVIPYSSRESDTSISAETVRGAVISPDALPSPLESLHETRPEDEPALGLDALAGEHYQFSNTREAAEMIAALRRSGAPQTVIRALLVEGWLKLLADPSQQAKPANEFMLGLPVEDRALFASSRLQALAQLAPLQFEKEISVIPAVSRSALAGECLVGFAGVDPGQALALARRLNRLGANVDESGIILQWGIKEPAAALAEVAGMKNGAMKAVLLSSACLGAVIGDAVAGWDAFSSLPGNEKILFDSGPLYMLRADVIQSLLANDNTSRTAAAVAQRVPNVWLCQDIFSALADSQPAFARTEVTRLLDSRETRDHHSARFALQGIANSFGAEDAEKGYAFLMDTFRKYRPPVLVGTSGPIDAFAEGVAAAGEEGKAWRLANASLDENSQLSREFGAPMTAALAVRDASSWKEAIQMLPESMTQSDRDQAIQTILRNRMNGADPRAAADLVAEISHVESRLNFLDSHFMRWVQKDAQSMLTWAGLHETDNPGASALAMRAWSAVDPHGASEAIAALPPGPARDAYIPGLALNISLSDPDLAVAWALRISGEEARQDTLTTLVRRTRDARRSIDSLLGAENLTEADTAFIKEQWARSR